MLTELKKSLANEQNESWDAQDFQVAAQRLLKHQFMHVDDYGCRPTYELIRKNLDYFTNLFEAFGFTLVHNDNEAMIGIVSEHPALKSSLKLEESIFLLALRMLYEQAVESYDVGDAGCVEIDSETLLQTIETLTHRTRVPFSRMNEILKNFRSNGLVRLEDCDLEESMIRVFIRPTIRYVTGQDVLTQIKSHAAANLALNLQQQEISSNNTKNNTKQNNILPSDEKPINLQDILEL